MTEQNAKPPHERLTVARSRLPGASVWVVLERCLIVWLLLDRLDPGHLVAVLVWCLVAVLLLLWALDVASSSEVDPFGGR